MRGEVSNGSTRPSVGRSEFPKGHCRRTGPNIPSGIREVLILCMMNRQRVDLCCLLAARMRYASAAHSEVVNTEAQFISKMDWSLTLMLTSVRCLLAERIP